MLNTSKCGIEIGGTVTSHLTFGTQSREGGVRTSGYDVL